MAYLSLYLKYRPSSFEGLLGQQHVARTLQNAVASDRVAHAYLFTGPRGTGKTTAARILARALNCEKGPTPQPCGECPPCRRIMQDACLDVVEVDAASRRRVEETSELLGTVGFLPAEVRYKVYVIDEVHMLSTHAFNSLLKTLEEPPGHVVFVLATTEAHKVPPTIVSRCQRFDFRRIGSAELLSLVRDIAAKERIQGEKEAFEFLAEVADGSARDAISLLEQAASYGGNKIALNDVMYMVGATEESVLEQFVTHAVKGDIRGGLGLVEEQMLMGRDIALLLRDLSEYLRDCLVLEIGGRGRRYLRGAERPPVLQSLNQATLMNLIQVVEKVGEELRWSSQHRLLCELAFIKMTQALRGTLGAEEEKEGRRGESMAKAVEESVPTSASATELTSAAVDGAVEGWGKVMAALERDRAIPLVQLVQGAVPGWDEEGNLTLSFNFGFNKEELERCWGEEMESRAYVEGLLQEAFGRRVNLKCLMANGGKGKPAKDDAPVIDKVRSVFPGSTLVKGDLVD